LASQERKDELLKGLYDGVVEFEEDRVADLSKAAVEEGVDAYEAIMKGLAAGMERVGELYASQEYFVPELLLCADALYAGLDILKPHLKKIEAGVSRKIVLGVVEGDIHDIGKTLVKVMFDAAGWEVYDLGNDVKVERFAEEQQRTNADLVGLSALMTTSMLAMPKIIKLVRSRDQHVPVIVGGAPLNRDIATQYGADGYAPNAGEAVAEAVRVLGEAERRRSEAGACTRGRP
jgi:corrinoid protein of di/trimethylamine methyltransferase